VFSFLKLPAAPRSGISATLQQAAGNALAVAVQTIFMSFNFSKHITFFWFFMIGQSNF